MNTVATDKPLVTTELKPRIGAAIATDVATLVGGQRAREIREILEQRGVVVFHDLHITDEQQLAFARTLGQVRTQGDKKESLFPISLDAKTYGYTADYLRGSVYWHIDGASEDTPHLAAILNAKKLSPTGGQTEFCNTYASWDDLPESEKKSLEKLKVVHTFEAAQRFHTPEPTYEQLKAWQSHPAKVHPMVWTHRSGRRSLVLGATASHIVGMDLEESSALLCRLREWATRPQFVYRHEWTIGDLLMWDNTGTMHRAMPYDPNCGRLMTRVTLEGEEPLV